ncbi:hypothetical protein ACKWTF_016890 [Chironomus riparius]
MILFLPPLHDNFNSFLGPFKCNKSAYSSSNKLVVLPESNSNAHFKFRPQLSSVRTTTDTSEGEVTGILLGVLELLWQFVCMLISLIIQADSPSVLSLSLRMLNCKASNVVCDKLSLS